MKHLFFCSYFYHAIARISSTSEIGIRISSAICRLFNPFCFKRLTCLMIRLLKWWVLFIFIFVSIAIGIYGDLPSCLYYLYTKGGLAKTGSDSKDFCHLTDLSCDFFTNDAFRFVLPYKTLRS